MIARYEYDGLGRRVKKHLNTDTDDDFDEFRHFYYNANWQLLETRKSTSEDTLPGTLKPERQYVWSLRYIDAPVLRDENKDDDDDCIDGQDERLYYLTDANSNVTCLTDTGGDAVERYVYDPYGNCTVYNSDWSATVAWADSKKNTIRYCGYHLDNETGLYHVRNRVLHPYLGWLQRDPIGYADGMGLYQYCRSGPLVSVDPRGLAVNGTLREDTVTVYDTQSSWDAAAEATELPDGANATAVPWVEAEVEGEYDPAHPCNCYFRIPSIDLGISIHIAGRGIVHSRGFAGIPTIGGRQTAADVELARMHEGFHREQYIAVWEKYRRQLSESGGCRYWRNWGFFRTGYVQSRELCDERAAKLAEYLADQLREYLEHAGLFFDARYASPQTAAGLKSTQAATMKEIGTMTMRDWNCDDTSLGWFR